MLVYNKKKLFFIFKSRFFLVEIFEISASFQFFFEGKSDFKSLMTRDSTVYTGHLHYNYINVLILLN